MSIAKKELLINGSIREKEVRTIDSDGSQLGVLPTRQALSMAYDKDMDLVMISPGAQPPVCKIMDYGKYRFEQSKRDKEAKKKQKVIENKEVRMGLNIDTHDLETKVGQATKFLSAGNKVKVSIRFRGRELAHKNLGFELMERFTTLCEEVGTIDKPPKMEGRSLVAFFSAKAAK
ncbi:translation initiation factor IF-3 [Neobittarella massiliensis]|uniref:translation initiation factor IF-3 n=1 Tax=Neobittarella massiliensis (ex Bilen et al. 2018) TaxID=2041842 RepID=UPI000CF6A493|nr:translation initiation factor IF-3 [Neobittarella massiliensis]